MVFYRIDLIDLVAVTLSLSIPIFAIIWAARAATRRKQLETEIRRAIIENHTDLETAKALIVQQKRKPNNYLALRWACILIGMGFGALANHLLGLRFMYEPEALFTIAVGIGLGLLVSFVIERKLQQKENSQVPQDEM